MKLMYLNALRALEAAVRLGSFRAASDELNVTAAAVGQQVKKLEEAFGVSLLTRGPNGFVPTDLARQVSFHLGGGFRQLSDAVEVMARGGVPGRVSISIVPTIAEYWLAPRLPEFWQQNPGTDLRLDSTSTILDPDQAHFDFALRYGPESPGAAVSTDLFPEYLVPACTPEIAAQLDLDDPINPFRRVTLLHPAPSTSDPDWLDWRRWCAAQGFTGVAVEAGPKFTFTTLAIRAMFAGHGLHLCQLSILLPALAEGRLVAPFGAASCARTGYSYRLVQFGRGAIPETQRLFADWIIAQAAGTRADLAAFTDRSVPSAPSNPADGG